MRVNLPHLPRPQDDSRVMVLHLRRAPCPNFVILCAAYSQMLRQNIANRFLYRFPYVTVAEMAEIKEALAQGVAKAAHRTPMLVKCYRIYADGKVTDFKGVVIGYAGVTA